MACRRPASTCVNRRSGCDDFSKATSLESPEDSYGNPIRADTTGNTGTNLGVIGKAGRDVAGRNIVYNQQPLLRSIIAVSAIVWLTAAGGLLVGARVQSGGTSPSAKTGGASGADGPTGHGTLRLAPRTRFYYPENGVLPTLPPPPTGGSEDFCETVHAAATTPILVLTTIAGSTSPITILDIRPVIYRKHALGQRNYLPCEFNAGGYAGTTAYVDLDHPTAPIKVDIGASGDQHATLPPGRFAVDASNAETMYMDLHGSPDTVYEYGIQMRVVENSVEKTRLFGSASDPLRIAFISSQPAGQNYDWDTYGARWVPAN